MGNAEEAKKEKIEEEDEIGPAESKESGGMMGEVCA